MFKTADYNVSTLLIINSLYALDSYQSTLDNTDYCPVKNEMLVSIKYETKVLRALIKTEVKRALREIALAESLTRIASLIKSINSFT